MPIATKRLDLIELTLADLKDVHALHSLNEVDEFNTLGIPSSINQTEKLLNSWIDTINTNTLFVFKVVNKQNGAFIGLFGIKMGKPNYRSAEVWYKLHPSFWNKGFATEALNAVLDFCFNDLKLHRIEAGCATENIASIKVLEKAGFKREGQKRKILPIRGQWTDNYFYAILEEDHNNQ